MKCLPKSICLSNFSTSPSSSSFFMLFGRWAVQDVETSITPGSATAAARAVVERGRPRHPEAGLAHAVDGDLRRVDLAASLEKVDHRPDHRLPVGPEGDLLLPQRLPLAGAVESDGVVAA